MDTVDMEWKLSDIVIFSLFSMAGVALLCWAIYVALTGGAYG